MRNLDLNDFSSLRKLVRITALVLCFIASLRKKVTQGNDTMTLLTQVDLQNAEHAWLKVAQYEMTSQDNFSQLVKVLRLVEEDGVYKCVGRMENSDLNERTRH